MCGGVRGAPVLARVFPMSAGAAGAAATSSVALLMTCIFSLPRSLSVLLIFLKNQLFVLLTFLFKFHWYLVLSLFRLLM